MTGDDVPSFGRTASALHDIATRSRVTARALTLPMENAQKADYLHALMERMERELAPSIRAMFAETLADPDAPDSVRAIIHATAQPANQFDAVLGLFAAFFGIFSIAGAIASVETEAYVHHLQAKLTPTPLSPQEMALALVKGVVGVDYAKGQAALSGVDGGRFDQLEKITGEPPAIQELLFLFRRGKIDAARLEHGIRQSRVRDEWIDAIRALEYVPPSPQEAIAAAVQGHLTIEEAATVVAENGVDPAAVPWLYETAGRPPGAEMLLTLMHRGLMSQADVEQAIRESDIKNKYIPAIIEGGVYIPPVRSVVAMLRAGAIDDNQARTLFAENGVRDVDASAYIAEAHKSRAVATHEAAQGQVVTAYRDRMITRPAAQARLEALKYPAADATFLLDVADTEAETVLRRGVITTTRSKYVGHHVDHATASAALDKANVPADQRDHLLALWDVERAETVRTLTPAVLVKGVKNGAVTYAEMISYMVALGYSDKDAALYAKIEGVGP